MPGEYTYDGWFQLSVVLCLSQRGSWSSLRGRLYTEIVCGMHGATSRPHRVAWCLDPSERGEESTDRDGDTPRGLANAPNAWRACAARDRGQATSEGSATRRQRHTARAAWRRAARGHSSERPGLAGACLFARRERVSLHHAPACKKSPFCEVGQLLDFIFLPGNYFFNDARTIGFFFLRQWAAQRAKAGTGSASMGCCQSQLKHKGIDDRRRAVPGPPTAPRAPSSSRPPGSPCRARAPWLARRAWPV